MLLGCEFALLHKKLLILEIVFCNCNWDCTTYLYQYVNTHAKKKTSNLVILVFYIKKWNKFNHGTLTVLLETFIFNTSWKCWITWWFRCKTLTGFEKLDKVKLSYFKSIYWFYCSLMHMQKHYDNSQSLKF
jgi:hypothetical protein